MNHHSKVRAAIRDDRDLLAMFGMSYSDAAMFLGRSRQALHQQLGPKNAEEARPPYFRVNEIITLVLAARQLGREFDAQSVLNYVRSTDRVTEPSFALLEKQLVEEDETDPDLDISEAVAIVYILAAFAEMRVPFAEAADQLKRTAEKAQDAPEPVPVFVVSATAARAQMAGSVLGLPDGHCFASHLADHHLPTAIVYGSGESRVFVLTRSGTFTPAAPFAQTNMAESALELLPENVRSMIRERQSSRALEAVRRGRSAARAA